jgi:uncharacterized hydrophobic protein (TIGR00271 family)
MLHVRLVSPPGSTKQLVNTLSANPGVRNLIILSGASRRPDGDSVQFDLLTQSANPVLRELRARNCPVFVENVDAALTPADTSTPARILRGEVAPVWEMVEARIRADAAYPPSFFLLLVTASLIAAVGILINSQILIVGAMVVGPEYGAITATAFGVTRRDGRAIKSGLSALAVGFAMAILVAAVFGLVIRWSGHTPGLFLKGVRPVSDLINSPNLFSVIVAVLAGITGVVALTESRANALIGVFISVTTIPAAADIGLSAAFGSWNESGGSALQLLLNVVLLIAVGAGGIVGQRAIWRRGPRNRPAQPARASGQADGQG